MKSVDAFRTQASFSAPEGQWPDECWWRAYGDAQLTALIEEALRDSPDMEAAGARMRRAAAFAGISRSALIPQLYAGASITEQKQSYNHLIPFEQLPHGWNDYGLATLNLNWEIDFWGKNRAGLAAATSELEAAKAGFALARVSLAAGVAMNYAQLARLYAVRDTVSRTVEIRAKTLDLFTERFEGGMETKGSVSEARARKAAAEGELLFIDEQIGLAKNRLAALAGAGPDRALCIKRPSVNLNGAFGLPAELAANLLGRRPDIIAARLRAEAQSQRIKQKKAEFYPNVNLVAFAGLLSLNVSDLSERGSGMGSVGPALSLPIFTAGRLRSELRGRTAAYDEAVANYNAALTHALEEIANVALSIKSLETQLIKGEEAVASATEAYRVARNRYEGGLATFIEVLFAEDILLGSQRNLSNLKSRSFALHVELQRALGGGYTQNKI